METNKKIRLLKLLVAILFLLNVTTISTILFTRIKATSENDEPTKTSKTGFSGNKHFFAYFLNLNKEQSDKLDKINEGFSSDMDQVGSKMRDLKIKMSQQIAANQNDTIKLNAIYDEILRIHAVVNEKNYEYYTNIRSICTPEQTIKLTSFFSKTIDLNRSAAGK